MERSTPSSTPSPSSMLPLIKIGRLSRRNAVILAGPLRHSSPFIVGGEDFGIGLTRNAKDLRQPEVMVRESGRREMSNYRLPNTIMVCLDLIPTRRPRAPNQSVCSLS
jgi:hypothetical protein